MTHPVPRFLPTLTDVLGHTDAAVAVAVADAPAALSTTAVSLASCLQDTSKSTGLAGSGVGISAGGVEQLEAEIGHRILQRVDMLLEAALSAAIARVIDQQTRSMLPALREEIADAVRASVTHAVAQELFAAMPAIRPD